MKDLKWKTLSSEYLFKDLWFTVRKDTCQRPDGKIVDPYYVYEFPTWVNALAITAEGMVILERQYRHGSGEVGYEIPGGCVDDTDSNYQQAIARELLEETGYEFTDYEYLGRISANPSTNNNWMHMYLATGGKLVQDQHLDENEQIEVELFTMEQLKEMLHNNQLTQAMHVTTVFYALKKLGVVSI